MMTSEEFETQIKNVYDNLTSDQFEFLITNCKNKVNDLIKSGDIDAVEEKFVGKNYYEVLSANVVWTVIKSRKISFKQFKTISKFSNTKWVLSNEVNTEYKQF